MTQQMGFYFNQTRCTGCYTCSVACKDWHNHDAGSVNWMRLKVIERGEFPDLFVSYLALSCCHCAEPSCAKVCPTNAITKTEPEGIVRIDQNKCIGKEECGMPCFKACPWNAPQFGPENNAVMQKCDLCYDRLAQGLKPICVDACPMYALDAGPMDDLRSKYGDNFEATGFRYIHKIKPSVIFTPKKA
jgi:anaerobic dimethyl sulfoxide reductase subunit B (iron-sulfur subunit)